MTNQPPLNPDALESAFYAVEHPAVTRDDMEDIVSDAVRAYLAAAQPVVNSVEELAKAWYVGFCKGEQTAFRDRPVNPDTINPYKNGENK